jgi:hypothetical protein
MQPIHIFRPGTHVAMNGQPLSFSESDLAASAAAYDPSIHEAPIVAGHPRHDLPAYGWVKKLTVGVDGLTAEPAQVDVAFAELVQAGRYKKVSASFFHPESKLNPVPGVWYLRHVGFLGAQPPAVKGLRQVEFSEAEEGVVTVEFGEVSPWTLKTFFQGLRDWFLVNHGQDAADKVVPSYLADEMDMAARREAEEDRKASAPLPTMFSEPAAVAAPGSPSAAVAAQAQEGDVMSDAEKARLAELEAMQATLDAKAAEFAEREQKLKNAEAAARHAEVEAFVVDQVKAGRVLPAEQAGLTAFMESVAADDVVEFAEGGAQVQKPAADWLRNFVSGLPARVDFSERARGAGAGDAGTASFSAPAGYGVDSMALDTHARAKALQASNPNLSFVDAVKAAEKEQA